jgi:xylose isomerase
LAHQVYRWRRHVRCRDHRQILRLIRPRWKAGEKQSLCRFRADGQVGIDYYCFHDRDIAPEAATWPNPTPPRRNQRPLLDLQKKYNKKLLWGTSNSFSNPRYASGAGTSPNRDVFTFAAAQIKKALELTVKLGGTGYVFWGGREGYETILNTNMGLELDNLARLMRLAVDYGRSIGFTGDFYVEPKPKEPTKHQYDYDSATVIGFLRHYGLDKDFKLNIEANHATSGLATPSSMNCAWLAKPASSVRSTPTRATCCSAGTPTNPEPTSMMQSAA